MSPNTHIVIARDITGTVVFSIEFHYLDKMTILDITNNAPEGKTVNSIEIVRL